MLKQCASSHITKNVILNTKRSLINQDHTIHHSSRTSFHTTYKSIRSNKQHIDVSTADDSVDGVSSTLVVDNNNNTPAPKSNLINKSTQSLLYLATAATCATGAQDLLSTITITNTPSIIDAATQWCSILGNLTAFFILSSVFVDDEEYQAALVYISGLVCTYLLLARVQYVLLSASSLPLYIFVPCTVLVMLSLAMNVNQILLLRRRKKNNSLVAHNNNNTNESRSIQWESWKLVILCIGCLVLPQIAYSTLLTLPHSIIHNIIDTTSSSSLLLHIQPFFISCAMLSGAFYLYSTGKKKGFFQDIAPWCATLLFMIEPLGTLLQYSIVGVSSIDGGTLQETLSSFLFPALSTALQIPRAHYLRISMWRLGTTWATFFTVVKASVIAWIGYQRVDVAIMLIVCICTYFYVVFATPWRTDDLTSNV